MNYPLIADYLWYAGNVLSGISILFTRDQYELAVSLVLAGQAITILSRPIGRITESKVQTIVGDAAKPEDSSNLWSSEAT